MKKLLIYLLIIAALFASLFILNKQSDSSDNVFGIPESKLNPATREQLDDPNYQNIILPDQLESQLEQKKDVLVYFYQSTCPHCEFTTPTLNKIAKEAGVDVKQFNLLEFNDGWQQYNIEATPTLVVFKDGKEADRMTGGLKESSTSNGFTNEDFKQFFDKYKP